MKTFAIYKSKLLLLLLLFKKITESQEITIVLACIENREIRSG